MIMELSITLFPAPVEPAISKCGMDSSAATLMRPLMSLPRQMDMREFESPNSSDSKICRRLINSRRELGTSIPTVGLPGMRSIRIDSACSPRHKSSESVVMRLYLMPASGLNSKVVTTGPGLIWTTLPRTLNSSNLALMRLAISFSSSESYEVRPGISFNSSVEGKRYSGCSVTSGATGNRPRVMPSEGAAASTGGGVDATCGGGSYSRVWMGISSSCSTGAGCSWGDSTTVELPAAAALARFNSAAASRTASLFCSMPCCLAALRSARTCARSSAIWRRAARHCSKRASMLRRMPSGPASQLAKVAIEKLEIRYRDRISEIPVTSAAPVRLSDVMRESASKTPMIPPAENDPFQGCHVGNSDSAALPLSISRLDPNTLIAGALISADRTQRQASIHSSTGMAKALSPSTCRQRSEVYDPAKPVRLWARVAPETEFQDGSCGW